MNVTEAQAGYRPLQESKTVKAVEGGAIIESVGAVATIALAIVGLAGMLSITMAALATLILGAAILIEGFALNYGEAALSGTAVSKSLKWNEGLTVEFAGGLAGIILGVLALLGAAPFTLVSVGAMVFGATFLLSGAVNGGASRHSGIGVAALVLGLLAVVGQNPLTLVLVALACLGASALFDGIALRAKMTVAART